MCNYEIDPMKKNRNEIFKQLLEVSNLTDRGKSDKGLGSMREMKAT